MLEVNLGVSMLSFCREEELRKAAEKINHDYKHLDHINGASSYSYLFCNNNNIDLNEPPSVSVREDEEQGNHENTNGASSSSSWRNNIDLNELPPRDSESEEPQQNPRCSSTLLGSHDIPENPPNPNPPSIGKRPLVRKRRSSGGLKKAKKRRPEAVLKVAESSPPKWLDQVMKAIEEAEAPHRISKAPLACEDAKLIFEKPLSKSDVNPLQSRYLIPFKKLKRNDFLTQVELSFLEQEVDEEGEKPGVGAILVNQRSEKWGLLLKIWKMKKKDSEKVTFNYALNCGWNDIVKGNGLKAKDKISLWSFRFEGVLYFALGTE